MLHNRQAPGRDFHKHFSLAPARSDTNPPSNPQSAPAPSPLHDRAQARNATSRAPRCLRRRRPTYLLSKMTERNGFFLGFR